MDAPTEWTYGGLVDWTSADTLRLMPIELVLRPIVEAVKERYTVAGLTLPSALSAWNPMLPVKTITDAIQSAATALMPKFVNHTDNGGDWSGQTEIPYWTEADVLIEIDSLERLELGHLSPLSAEWCFQQYQILNLLRWILEKPALTYNHAYKSVSEGAGVGGSSSDAVAAAQAAFEAKSWTEAGEGTWVCQESGLIANPYWTASFASGRGKLRAQNLGYSNSINCDIDMYIFPVTFMDVGVYNSSDGFIENEFNLFQSFSNVSAQYTYSNYLFDYMQDPAPEGVQYYECYVHSSAHTNYTGYHNVLKYDIANGFKFQ